jgi:hypothetical protein
MLINALNGYLEGKIPTALCLVGKWLEEQEADVKEVFYQLYERESINFSALYRAIEESELPFKFTTFKVHMKGQCQCPRP